MTRTEYVTFSGGVNLDLPQPALKSGELTFCQNYEIAHGGLGYQRIAGFERFDGQNSPELTPYFLLRFRDGAAAVADGETIEGASSGAQATVLLTVVESGDFNDNDAAGYWIIVPIVGEGPSALAAFSENEDVEVGASPVAVVDAEATSSAPIDTVLHRQYREDARAALRARIESPPGSGPIRGVVAVGETVYAFRDTEDGLSLKIHKSSPSGWVEVPLGRRLAFSSGSTAIKIGETLTGSTSGAAGTVVGVAVNSGSWAGNNAAGFVYFASHSGTFQSSENLNQGSGTIATAGGASTAITLEPGGRWEFSDRPINPVAWAIYGCDGVNIPIILTEDGLAQTATTLGVPRHLAVYENRLFFGYPNGELSFSGLGEAGVFSAAEGAGQIRVQNGITALKPIFTALLVFTRQSLHQLFGSTPSDWIFRTITEEGGALEWTIQELGVPLYLSDYGVMSLQSTAAFGNFLAASLSQNVNSWLQAYRPRVQASCIFREKGQYRLFFNDGQVMSITFERDQLQGITFATLPLAVTCTWSTLGDAGERIFAGADNGQVVELERGPTFDGEAVESVLLSAFYHYGDPQRKKRFYRLVFDLKASDPLEPVPLTVTPNFSYGAVRVPAARQHPMTAQPLGGLWNRDSWDAFLWNGQLAVEGEVPIAGVGENLGLFVYAKNTHAPHTLYGVAVEYGDRGRRR